MKNDFFNRLRKIFPIFEILVYLFNFIFLFKHFSSKLSIIESYGIDSDIILESEILGFLSCLTVIFFFLTFWNLFDFLISHFNIFTFNSKKEVNDNGNAS